MDNEGGQAHKRQRERSIDSADGRDQLRQRSPSPLEVRGPVNDNDCSGDEGGPSKDELSGDEQPENLSSSNLKERIGKRNY